MNVEQFVAAARVYPVFLRFSHPVSLELNLVVLSTPFLSHINAQTLETLFNLTE